MLPTMSMLCAAVLSLFWPVYAAVLSLFWPVYAAVLSLFWLLCAVVLSLFQPLCVVVLPGSFQACVHAAVTACHMESGVRNAIRAGGCTSSRASFVGACLGAQVNSRLVSSYILSPHDGPS